MSFTEVLLILAIALVILGPERLPGLARSLGRAMREFRKASREIRATLEVEEVRRTIKERVAERADDTKPKPETERTGAGTVAWKEGVDDLADKKKDLEDARAQRVETETTKRPVEAPDERSDTAPKPPTSNAKLNENKLDLTSRTIQPEEPSAKPDGETDESASKPSSGS